MIILDNSILSAFKRINALNLIRELFEDVTVPTKVYEEFVKKWGQPEVPAWVKVQTLSNDLNEEAQRIKLGFGEAQAIVLAKYKKCLLALDDRKAREEATERRVNIIGSAGILRIAYEYCPIKTKQELRKLLRELEKDLYLDDWLKRWILETKKQASS